MALMPTNLPIWGKVVTGNGDVVGNGHQAEAANPS
jgi:hypothetical protein